MRETKVLSADGTELAARCSGSGTPMVLVHGAMADLNTFALVEGILAERHSVWVYSRRGRGGSGDGPGYSIDSEIADVLAVLAAAGEGAHLVGHSSGGFYSLLAASCAPSLRSLSLYEPPLHIEEVDESMIAGVESALAADDPDRALEIFFPTADIVEEEMNMVRAQEPIWNSLRDGVRHFPREHRALKVGAERLSKLAPLSLPVLYLHGEESRAPVYPSLDEVAARFPRGRVHCLRRQRHLAPIFDPSAFAEAILSFTAAHDGERRS